MRKKRKSITGFLISSFIFGLIIAMIFSVITFSRITQSTFEEIKGEIVETSQSETIENQIEAIFGIAGSRVLYTLISSLFIGVLIMTVMSRKIVKPIKALSRATNEIAKGNYDIEIQDNIPNDELGELKDNFNKMARTLKNVEYLQKDFMSNVSHEFKTPVAAIQGYAILLQDNDLSEVEREKYLKIIIDESKRLSNLSTNVLKLSRIENKDFKINLEQFSLDEQIRKSILILEPSWKKKNINFLIKLEETNIIADKELLQQVWLNIIGNAIKFSDNNGKIAVSLKKEKLEYIIKIEDNGIGISEENQERIFDRFFQEDKAHIKEGNGLGLTICKKIIDLHSGQIELESSPNKGTKFFIKIPI